MQRLEDEILSDGVDGDAFKRAPRVGHAAAAIHCDSPVIKVLLPPPRTLVDAALGTHSLNTARVRDAFCSAVCADFYDLRAFAITCWRARLRDVCSRCCTLAAWRIFWRDCVERGGTVRAVHRVRCSHSRTLAARAEVDGQATDLDCLEHACTMGLQVDRQPRK
eukprot:3264360-Prymnesium_polylepis.1